MKKLILAAAVTALGLTACTKNEITENLYDSNAIEFNTYIGQSQTKAGGITKDNLAYMTVNAIQSGETAPTFMTNQLVSKTASGGSYAWTYNPRRFWPTSGTVSFYAVSTNSNAALNVKSKEIDGKAEYVYEFTQPSDVAGQLDLVHAAKTGLDEGPVSFNFRHTLSRIGFSAKSGLGTDDHKYNKIVVDEIVIGDASKATFRASNDLIVIGEGEEYKWGTSTETADGKHLQYTLTAGNDMTKYKGTNLGVLSPSSYTSLNDDDAYLMVIPYEFQKNNVKIPVTVKYTIYITPTAIDADNNITAEQLTALESYTNEVPLEISADMATGCAYRIKLDITPREVKFEVNSVDNWKDDAGSEKSETQIDPIPASGYETTYDEVEGVNTHIVYNAKGMNALATFFEEAETRAAEDEITDNIIIKGKVDMSELATKAVYEWKPLFAGKVFNGTFDGGGNTISNLNISATGGNVGFFERIGESGKVQNVKFDNITIKSISQDDQSIGVLAGVNNGVICGVEVSNSNVSVETPAIKKYFIGGVVGQGNSGGVISGCLFYDSTISFASIGTRAVSTPSYFIGGIVGENNLAVISCLSKNARFSATAPASAEPAIAPLWATMGRMIGGIAGDDTGYVASCYAYKNQGESAAIVNGSDRALQCYYTTAEDALECLNTYTSDNAAFTGQSFEAKDNWTDAKAEMNRAIDWLFGDQSVIKFKKPDYKHTWGGEQDSPVLAGTPIE